MNLTYSLLSTMIKYPRSSTSMNPRSSLISDKKMGYFKSEEELFLRVQKITGTNGRRNPLTFILEAADDIAYATADIEDAFKKGFFDYPTFTAELWKRKVDKEYIEQFIDVTNTNYYLAFTSLTNENIRFDYRRKMIEYFISFFISTESYRLNKRGFMALLAIGFLDNFTSLSASCIPSLYSRLLYFWSIR